MKQKNLLRSIILFTLMLPFLSKSQENESTCIKSKWLSLELNEENQDIFLAEPNMDASSDIVFVIKALLGQDKLKIYEQSALASGAAWSPIDYKAIIKKNQNDPTQPLPINPFFERVRQSDLPLVDENGDALIRVNEEGISEYVYPPIESQAFLSNDCDEIRIKEDRVFNEVTKKYEFVPVGVAFFFRSYGNDQPKELFWVDLNELFKAMDTSMDYSWAAALREKRYAGKQYMQIACDEEVKQGVPKKGE
jgi:hypothetical protein